ncbi:MAG: caspase family protein [Thermomicrobiales bacterium]|nr:caspase family protein [Thermomicrobiales bacterium]
MKRAICIGINDYPGEDNDLKGCVNDARAWAELLSTRFDFDAETVRVIEDSEATKENIVGALTGLVAGASPGDVLVLTNSSHGSYVADTDGDEPTYDEIICPYDIMDNVLLDDELRELFTTLPDGVSFTAILDNCFSGTATRVPSLLPTPDDRRHRFLRPRVRGDKELDDPWEAHPASGEKYPQEGMKEVLLSGCSDKQYSFDAKIEGVYHGAMTWHAIKAIRDANYCITYRQLHDEILRLLELTNYDQTPQLEGRESNKDRLIFS